MYNWGMISSLDRTLFIFRQNIVKDRNMHKTLVIYVCNISHTKRKFCFKYYLQVTTPHQKK